MLRLGIEAMGPHRKTLYTFWKNVGRSKTYSRMKPTPANTEVHLSRQQIRYEERRIAKAAARKRRRA